MKVVLKQDVKSIGKKDELHEVSDGYARNYLLPRGLAVARRRGGRQRGKDKSGGQRASCSGGAGQRAGAGQKAEWANRRHQGQGGPGRRLFGSVTSKDIAAALTQKVGEPVDKRKIVLDGDIKNFGSYEVEVKVYPKVTAKLTVKVEE